MIKTDTRGNLNRVLSILICQNTYKGFNFQFHNSLLGRLARSADDHRLQIVLSELEINVRYEFVLLEQSYNVISHYVILGEDSGPGDQIRSML